MNKKIFVGIGCLVAGIIIEVIARKQEKKLIKKAYEDGMIDGVLCIRNTAIRAMNSKVIPELNEKYDEGTDEYFHEYATRWNQEVGLALSEILDEPNPIIWLYDNKIKYVT